MKSITEAFGLNRGTRSNLTRGGNDGVCISIYSAGSGKKQLHIGIGGVVMGNLRWVAGDRIKIMIDGSSVSIIRVVDGENVPSWKLSPSNMKDIGKPVNVGIRLTSNRNVEEFFGFKKSTDRLDVGVFSVDGGQLSFNISDTNKRGEFRLS